MKDQVLDPGNRAALQALASLSGIVGLGALLSGVVLDRVGPKHRDAGLAAFEVFVVVAVLTSAIFTAILSVMLLNRNEAISGADLFRVSAPLLIALVLAVFLTSVGRFATLTGGLSSNFPILLATLFGAVAVGAVPVFLAPAPSATLVVAGGILVIGVLVGLAFLSLERFNLSGQRRRTHERLRKLSASGYLPVRRCLQAVVPNADGEPAALSVVCWTHKGRTYFDQTEARRLCRTADTRWSDLIDGKAAPPVGEIVLRKCLLKTILWPWPPKFVLAVAIDRRQGSNEVHRVDVNNLGLFDVSDLGLVAEMP